MKPYWQQDGNKIYQGNVLDVLKALPDESVHCCVTSPPYWGLRDYGIEPQIWGGDPECEHVWEDNTYVRNNDKTAGEKQRTNIGAIGRDEPVNNAFCQLCGTWKGSLGLEPTPELFIQHIVQIFREVRRVLRSDGTLWLNLGDSYAASGSGAAHETWTGNFSQNQDSLPRNSHRERRQLKTLKPKDLCGIPWRCALALQADGWWLRSDIIWHKPNPMPESVTDRPTKAHEYMFLLTKSAKYFYDAEAVKEKGAGNKWGKYSNLKYGDHPGVNGKMQSAKDLTKDEYLEKYQRVNKRTVWTIPTHPFPAAHFATFPPALVEPCILAGTSEKGCCAECGRAIERVVEKGELQKLRGNSTAGPRYDKEIRDMPNYTPGIYSQSKTTGWRPTCNCSFLSCDSCFTVIDSKNITVKEKEYGEKRRSSEIRTPSQLHPVWEGISNLSKEQQVLRQEMRSEMDDNKAGRPRENKNVKGIHYASQTESPNGDKGRICNGAPLFNGETYREESEKRGSGTSHQRGNRRQQYREPNHTDTRTAQLPTKREKAKGNRVPPLQEKNQSSLECPVCGKEATYKSYKTTPCVILDCFGGAMTTAIVAHKLGRKFVMIELSKKYIDEIGIPRIEKETKQRKLW